MAEVTATPNPVSPGADYTLSGCGFEMRPVEVYRDGAFIHAIGVVSAGGGCLDGNYFPAPDEPGDHLVELWQSREHGPKKDLVASTTLVVE